MINKKILVDLIHPANYHYFKGFISIMETKGYSITITAREKDVLHRLMDLDGRPYISSGPGRFGPGAIGKLLYLIYAEIWFGIIISRLQPFVVLSFGSMACAHNSFFFRIPHISFEDTEHARLNRSLYAPFSDMILTPDSFYAPIKKNHFKFSSYMELFYLHPQVFSPEQSIYDNLGVKEGEKIVLIRFVSWNAFHDIGEMGLSADQKLSLIKFISSHARVFISSEATLPNELERYKINIPENRMHDMLAFCDLYIGEGGTMASESALLGVPAIYINSLPLMGYLKDEQAAGLLFHYAEEDLIRKKALEVLTTPNSQQHYREIRNNFLKDKIEPTEMLVWLIENYPQSKQKLSLKNRYLNEN